VRSLLVFCILFVVKTASRIFYRFETAWIGDPPGPELWREVRLIAFLNHTSLFEPIFAGGVPNALLWRLATKGLVPAAQKTTRRPLVGLLFKLVAKNVIPITRERDHTWDLVMARIAEDSMVVILPEGRMKRRNGLDAQGQPMTVRGGISDILEAIPSGPMLVAYSGGLHHVQAPGETIPGIFRTVRMNFEVLDIADYRAALAAQGGEVKAAVKADLERRRDSYCPAEQAA
jgi:hypothetical protein